MKRENKAKRWIALALALCLCAAALPAAAPAEASSAGSGPSSGQDRYVSLHKYVSKTDIPNVFKVTLSVKGQLEPPTIGIFFMVDKSGSMNSNPQDGGVVTGSEPKIRMTTAAIDEALNIFFDPSVNEAYENTYIGMAYYSNLNLAWQAGTAALPQTNIGVSQITGMSTAEIYTQATGATTNTNFPLYDLKSPDVYTMGGTGVTAVAGRTTVTRYHVAPWDSVMESNWRMLNQTSYPMVNYSEKARLSAFANEINVAGSNSYKTGSPKTSYGSSRMEVLPHVYNWLSNPSAATGGKADHFDKIYVIIMSDGTDDGTTLAGDSVNYFQAIKGDPSVDYFGHNLHLPQFFSGASSPHLIGKGLDGTVMGIALGIASSPRASVANWSNNVMDFPVNTALPGTNVDPEEASTIFNAAITKENGVWKDNPTGFNGFTVGTNSAETWFKRANAANVVMDSSTGGMAANYKYVNTRAGIIAAYQDYAYQIVGELGTDVFVEDKLGSFYTMYSMPGSTFLETAGAPKVNGTGSWSGGTASLSGGDVITWDIPSIPSDGAAITLTYYVKLDEDADPKLSYPTNEYAYISYNNAEGLPIRTYFAVPYASAGGEVENSEAITVGVGGGDSGGEESTALSGAVAMFSMPYGSNVTPYTPSVTPSFSSLANESLQSIENETVADAVEEVSVANTGAEGSGKPLLAVCVAASAVVLAAIAFKRRTR